MDGRRAARQDDALQALEAEAFVRQMKGDDFGINAGLANPAGNQLGELRAEVDDQNPLIRHGEEIKQRSALGKVSEGAPE